MTRALGKRNKAAPFFTGVQLPQQNLAKRPTAAGVIRHELVVGSVGPPTPYH